MYILFGGCQFAFWRLNCSGRAYKKGGPKKGGILGFSNLSFGDDPNVSLEASCRGLQVWIGFFKPCWVYSLGVLGGMSENAPILQISYLTCASRELLEHKPEIVWVFQLRTCASLG